jgi:hypothetical protein
MKKGLRLIWRIILWTVLIYLGTSTFFVLLYIFVNPPITPLMAIRYINPVSESQPYRMHKKWVNIDAISPNLQLAVVASEDNKFTEHWGGLISRRSRRPRSSTSGNRGRRSGGRARSPSRPPRMSFSGRSVHGSGKGWRSISPPSSNSPGARSGSWRCT